MRIKEAVAKRIIQLCEERGMAVNALANRAGIPPSTLYSIIGAKSQNPGVVTLQEVCDGLEITIREFFDSDIFSDIEQEVK